MAEPTFVFQTDIPMTPDKRMEWLRNRAEEASANGAAFHRASIHPDIPHLTLLESWDVRPDDQGEPRWGWLDRVGGPLK